MDADLPSWQDGPTRTAILRFVEAASSPSSPDHVPADRRIAAFSNDGVLWCRSPLPPEALFARHRLAQLALTSPAISERPAFAPLMDRDTARLENLGPARLYEAVCAVHAGEELQSYGRDASIWCETTPNPELIMPISRLIYRPQAELLALLGRAGFRSFIVSAGDTAFIRATTARLLGVPPHRVIGSEVELASSVAGGVPTLARGARVIRFNQGPAKVVSIEQRLGAQPILAFGGADADLPMLMQAQRTKTGGLSLLLHHDDPFREVAYDHECRLAPLAEGLRRGDELGIVRVSMRRDWETIFS